MRPKEVMLAGQAAAHSNRLGALGSDALLRRPRRARIRGGGRLEQRTGVYAIAGLVEHLPSITLFGAHSVNAYRRFAPEHLRTRHWSTGRSAAARSPGGTEASASSCAPALRIPIRTRSSPRAAVIAGLHSAATRGRHRNLYGRGTPLPDSLGTALALATQDDTILGRHGRDSYSTSP